MARISNSISDSQKPTRVTIYTWMDPLNQRAGGDVRFLAESARRLVRDGFRVSWISCRVPGEPDECEFAGVEIHRCGSIYTVYFAHHVNARARRERECDVTIETLSSIPFLPSKLGRRSDVVLLHHVVDFRQMIQKIGILAPFSFAIDRLICPWAYRKRRILVPSEATRSEVLGVGYRHVEVFRPGTDVPTVDLKSKGPLVLAPGPVKPWKHHEEVIEAFSPLAGSWSLEIFGPFETRHFELYLKSYASESAAHDRIRILGPITETEKGDLLRRASVCVLASEKEGWGLAAMEAQAAGVPVVAYDIPGLRETVIDGVTGYLVTPRQPAALTTALRKLTESASLRLKMGEAACRHAGQFDFERSYLNFRSLLFSNLGSTTPSS